MKNDTEKARKEFVDWLKKNGIYDPMYSARQMQLMHEVYWTMEELNAELLEAWKDIADELDNLAGCTLESGDNETLSKLAGDAIKAIANAEATR